MRDPGTHDREGTDDNAVDIHEMAKSFRNVRAVDGLGLTIALGESVVILGPNGAGKSTIINMMLGLVAPDAGSVSIWDLGPREAVAAATSPPCSNRAD